MFTGIVQAVGRIETLHPHRVATGRLPLGDVASATRSACRAAA